MIILKLKGFLFFIKLKNIASSTEELDIILALYKDEKHINLIQIATILLSFFALLFSLLTIFINTTLAILEINKHAHTQELIKLLLPFFDWIFISITILLLTEFIFSVVLYNSNIHKIYMKKLHLINSDYKL